MEEDYKLKYCRLVEKVKVMLLAQQTFFKTRDRDDLKKAKAIESEVSEIVNPKPKLVSQTKLDWLAQ